MKRKIIIMASLLVLGAGRAGAQWLVTDFTNLVQGIVNSSNEMVQTSSTAQTMIQNFRETQKIFNQSKEYYDKLRAVNDLVRDARKVQRCILLVGEISQIYVNSYDRMLSDGNFSVRELSAIAAGYTRLLEEAAYALSDLKGIVNPSDLSMTDKDRLDAVDKSYEELTRLRNLASYYTRKNIGVALLRSRRQDDMERFLSLYGTADEKYR